MSKIVQLHIIWLFFLCFFYSLWQHNILGIFNEDKISISVFIIRGQWSGQIRIRVKNRARIRNSDPAKYQTNKSTFGILM